jgi:hypothetical protein
MMAAIVDLLHAHHNQKRWGMMRIAKWRRNDETRATPGAQGRRRQDGHGLRRHLGGRRHHRGNVT